MLHISVMIPVYNHSHFIGQAIESILNQQCQDLDVVVVDDASTDNTCEIVSCYCSDSRVQYVRNEENLGMARNWNRCLELAKGPLVMLFHSDDMLDPDYLTQVSQIFERYPQVGLVYSPVRHVDANNQVTEQAAVRPARYYQAGDEALTALLTTGIHPLTTVMRRECYERLGGYNEGIRDGPDIELFARIASRYNTYDLGRIYGSFRVHDNKAGHLSYLRQDRLDSYMYGTRLIWGYLSPEGLRRLGINDLGKFIAEDGARFARNGAIMMMAHGRPDLTLYYLRWAAKLDAHMWKQMHFWRAIGLLIAYPFSRRLVRSRMKY
jgi:glycosyltransferase involved in cell wall biosynthesis